ncbi:MAG: cysteine synthase A [Sulfurospirillaceae bacterium]|nr:cysteine synthase A [Sulfurospirillaceae bacterium]MDD3463336.1 cysteine synthase A [Sulfurospirillaceae bacterium]
MKYAHDVTELIGNTPLVKLKGASEISGALILGKCEFLNPTHSIKDRIALNMIKDALDKGLIDKNSVIIEPTSGNTGIGLASVCATYGLNLTLTMPSSMSIERRMLLSALGAKLVLTEPQFGMKGAVDKANELAKEIPNAFIPQQFANEANASIHETTTAQEIWADTQGKIDIFVAAVGTGGTITGTMRGLRKHNPNIEAFAVEPDLSPVLSGGKAGSHKIQGIGAGFIPQVLDTSIYGEVVQVSFEDAIKSSRELAKNEGLLVGISAGANVFAATLIGSRAENRGKTIVTILCDTGERYLSSGLYE